MSLSIIALPQGSASSPVVDIVAVHGLGGDAVTTWTHPKSNKFWLRDFLPREIPDARIMTFGYNADVAFGKSTAEIVDHSKSLLASLVDKREESEETYRPLIFIAHSLGGIVVKEALFQAGLEQRYRPVKDATLGLVFMGTPHRGSDKASYGKVLANVAQFLSHRPPQRLLNALESNSNALQRLTADFNINFLTTRFIVEKYSALLEIEHEEQVPVDADHSAMCKFETDQDDTFEKVYKRIKRMKNDPRRITKGNSVSHNDHGRVPHGSGAFPGSHQQDPQRLTGPSAPVRQSSQLPSTQLTLAPSASIATSSQTGTAANVAISPNHGSLIPTGWTGLHAAVNNSSIEGVTAILAMGRDPNVQTSEGWTPLRGAACHGSLEISRLLLEAGARVNTTNRQGTTALKEAAQIGAAELVRMLIERGADLELAPHDIQDTPLIAASAEGHLEVVIILLDAGADPRAQTSAGCTPLHYALQNGNEEMADLILGHHPDINASTDTGVTALHFAARAGLTDICARLLDLGASINAMDHNGLTPLRVAVQAGQLETVQLLVETGARTDVLARDGHTLTEVASDLGHVRVHQYLNEHGTR